jgi:N-acetylglucosaminyl-diphospho-decaprenol L-rhamnosyltransferase
MTSNQPFTASVVSHGQMRLVNLLVDDLIRHAGPGLRRLVITVNVPEEEALRADHAPFEVLVVRNDRAKGFGANHNQAFKHCETDWFAVLNPDLRLDHDVLGALLAFATPTDGLLAPTILDSDRTPADAARRVPTPMRLAGRKFGQPRPGPDNDFDWLAGMCLLVNARAFRSLGGFDERFFMYCEDTELCLRMQNAGWRLRWIKRICVVHDARRQSRRSLAYLRWHVASLLSLWFSRVFWTYLIRRRSLQGLRQIVVN